MAAKDPPLDEVQWRAPPIAQQFQGIHSNSVLFYFAESPFFDPQSNNGIYARQAMFNPAMAQQMFTREQFEAVLSQMPNGTEFRVAHAPADMVTGTGVWVIVKHERERGAGVTPIAHYFVVGENVYQAPTFGDIMSSKIESISDWMSKVLPAVDSVRSWTPSLGHAYDQPPTSNDLNSRTQQSSASKEGTPMPSGEASSAGQKPAATSPFSKGDQTALDRLAEESFAIHMRHGGDYIDENPITGRPGEFYLSSTGRKEKATASQQAPASGAAANANKPVPTLNTKAAEEAKKEGKADKSPRTPGGTKPKRKKSKISGVGSAGPSTAAPTPQPSS